MGKVSPERVRAVAVIGHGSTGKTSLVEAFLFNAGTGNRLGRIEDGTTHTDHDPEEIKRKISINSTAATCNWGDSELNVVDCPGFVDFLPEVRAVIATMDSNLICVSAQAGAEAQTERCFEFVREFEKPAIACVTKMDKDGADFGKTLHSLETAVGGTFVAVAVPIGVAEEFRGVVDVLSQKAYYYGPGMSGQERPVPPELKDAVAAYRERLVEKAAEGEDALTEKYLDGEELTTEEITRGLRAGVRKALVVPVVACCPTRNIGVKQVMDAVQSLLPTPLERPFAAHSADKKDVVLTPSADGELVATVFKVLHEPHVGDIVMVRVLNGSLHQGTTVWNATRGEKEKIGQILKVMGKQRTETVELVAGEIGALLKLHNTRAGDTLCSEKRTLVLPPVNYPEPTILYAVKPHTQADREKLANVLSRLAHDDPAIRAYTDPGTHEIIFAGAGDVQLEIFVSRLKERHHIQLEVAKPRIPYLETVRGGAEAEGKIKKQTGGHGQFAVVNLRIEPNQGKGFQFVDAIVGGVVPRNFIPAVEKGLREALPHGVLGGYPVTDVKVTLFYGKYHDVDSSEQAFKTAASIGFKEAVRSARPVLLEPIMNVSLTVPDACMGDVIGDLNSRRGRVQGMDSRDHKTHIKALVPQSEMYRYITHLRSMTGGRGEFVMALDHYEELPPNLAAPIVAEHTRAVEAGRNSGSHG